MNVTIVTGISGAGKSTALKALEDIDFLCADNIPPSLIPDFVKTCISSGNYPNNIALAVDIRMGAMFENIYEAIEQINNIENIHVDILFLDATDSVLVSRYTQTRRKHPLSGSGNLMSGIFAERDRLQKIKDMSTYVIDTSLYTNRQLASAIQKLYLKESDQRLNISVISFGYKRGIPMDADLVFDMRFIPNPFYIKELRKYTGLDHKVSDFIFSFPEAKYFLSKVTEIVLHLAPFYMAQDKKQLTIGIGCTGGMHRSVAMSEALYKKLQELNCKVSIEHRDIAVEQAAIKIRYPDQK